MTKMKKELPNIDKFLFDLYTEKPYEACHIIGRYLDESYGDKIGKMKIWIHDSLEEFTQFLKAADPESNNEYSGQPEEAMTEGELLAWEIFTLYHAANRVKPASMLIKNQKRFARSSLSNSDLENIIISSYDLMEKLEGIISKIQYHAAVRRSKELSSEMQTCIRIIVGTLEISGARDIDAMNRLDALIVQVK